MMALRPPLFTSSPTNPDIQVTVTHPDDPASVLFKIATPTVLTVYKRTCYICNDPEFAAMGMSVCTACEGCGGHIAADDVTCDDCGESIAYDRAMSE